MRVATNRSPKQIGCTGEWDDIGTELGARAVTDLLDNSVWLAIGLIFGLGAGWAITSRRIGKRTDDAIETLQESERQRRVDLATALEESERQTAALRTDDTELRKQIEISTARIEQLAGEAREQTRELDRAEARIFDRESTIDSLRAKLFASRNTARSIESELEANKNELELLKKHFNELHAAMPDKASDSDALSAIVVDLGDTLSVDRE